MPFTASLGKDRKASGLAPCSAFLKNGTWEKIPWRIRKEYCQPCHFRFQHQPSCSLDFLTFGDIEQFKNDLAAALQWIHGTKPGGGYLNGAQFEVDLAYYLLKKKTPLPGKVIADFVEKFLSSDPKTIDQFRKLWNFAVEGYEGKPFVIDGKGFAYRKTAEALTAFWMKPRKFSGVSLYHLYAAISTLEDTAANLDLVHLREPISLLVEATRRAIMSEATLEVS